MQEKLELKSIQIDALHREFLNNPSNPPENINSIFQQTHDEIELIYTNIESSVTQFERDIQRASDVLRHEISLLSNHLTIRYASACGNKRGTGALQVLLNKFTDNLDILNIKIAELKIKLELEKYALGENDIVKNGKDEKYNEYLARFSFFLLWQEAIKNNVFLPIAEYQNQPLTPYEVETNKFIAEYNTNISTVNAFIISNEAFLAALNKVTLAFNPDFAELDIIDDQTLNGYISLLDERIQEQINRIGSKKEKYTCTKLELEKLAASVKSEIEKKKTEFVQERELMSQNIALAIPRAAELIQHSITSLSKFRRLHGKHLPASRVIHFYYSTLPNYNPTGPLPHFSSSRVAPSSQRNALTIFRDVGSVQQYETVEAIETVADVVPQSVTRERTASAIIATMQDQEDLSKPELNLPEIVRVKKLPPNIKKIFQKIQENKIPLSSMELNYFTDYIATLKKNITLINEFFNKFRQNKYTRINPADLKKLGAFFSNLRNFYELFSTTSLTTTGHFDAKKEDFNKFSICEGGSDMAIDWGNPKTAIHILVKRFDKFRLDPLVDIRCFPRNIVNNRNWHC